VVFLAFALSAKRNDIARNVVALIANHYTFKLQSQLTATLTPADLRSSTSRKPWRLFETAVSDLMVEGISEKDLQFGSSCAVRVGCLPISSCIVANNVPAGW
jgi:hypothetical protein